MASTVANAARAMHGNSVASGCLPEKAKAAKVALDCPSRATQGNRSPILALIEEAMIRADVKAEAMAAFAVIDASVFSRGLKQRDNKAFNAAWLDNAPLEFWIAFHKLIGLKFNLTTETRRDLILKRTEQLMEDIKELLRLTLVSE